MAPVSLHRGHLGERVHGVEYDEVGVPEEGDEGLGLAAVFELVLGVGGVDEYFAARLEPIAVGISRMALDLGRHAYAAGRVGPAGHKLDEFDLRGKLVERYRETRRRLLQAQRLLEDIVT